MQRDAEVIDQAYRQADNHFRSFWLFAAALAVVFSLLLVRLHTLLNGDVLEYGLTTIALADHGTPDIRLRDLEAGRQLMPAFAANMDQMAAQIRSGAYVAVPGILHYRDSYYAIHFFGYSLLAAGPYALLRTAGGDPTRCFLVVNTAFVFILGLAMYRLFGSPWRAALGLAAWLLCGGALYWQWSSPECMSACALLAGLILYTTGAPVLGGLLAGLGAMQNPPIVFFCAFAPLLRIVLGWRKDHGLRANLQGKLVTSDLTGIAACISLFTLPVLFNLYVFNVPSVIASMTTDASLITAKRLYAFLFDLNQGLVLGVPAVLSALLFWRGQRAAALVATAFTVSMALPSLSTQNFNSGASGIMRYALWASMPLLFMFLWRLRLAPRWPVAGLLAVFVVQAAAMSHARSYNHVSFSPLARFALDKLPAWYNPEPEVFAERTEGGEVALDRDKVFAWRVNGSVAKTMYHSSSAAALKRLCGIGRTLAPDSKVIEAGGGWRYIDGPVTCMPAVGVVGQPGVALGSGWSTIEHGGGAWDGVWSDGTHARLAVHIDPHHRPSRITLNGHYFSGDPRTRVLVNGVDLGWQRLDLLPELPVPPADAGDTLTIDLQFGATRKPDAREPDQRQLGFFLQKVTMK